MIRIVAFGFIASVALAQIVSAEDDAQARANAGAKAAHSARPQLRGPAPAGLRRPITGQQQFQRTMPRVNNGAQQPRFQNRTYTPINRNVVRRVTPTTPAVSAEQNTAAVKPQPQPTNSGTIGSSARRHWTNRNGNGDWRNRNGNQDWRNRDTGVSGEQNVANGRAGDHRWRNRGDHTNWRFDRSRHDRSWWRSRYNRFALFAGGYYYWDGGYWYPAYGYDPYFSTYTYDAPIYGYNDLPPEQVMSNVQAELARRGYYRGSIDGSYGPLTRSALLQFQQDNGLETTGTIDEPTLETLGFQ